MPADLSLQHFIGAVLTQIALGEFQIQFCFMPEVQINVEGRWEVHDHTGRLVDHARRNDDRDAYRVHHLLGHHVRQVQIRAPESITLEFDNGYRLQIFDSSQQFESFTIHPGRIIV